MVSITTKINRGMKMDYRDWDIVADSAWLSFYIKGKYLEHDKKMYVAIMGTDNSKLKELQFRLEHTEWIRFDFYDLEMKVVEGITHMIFKNTVKKFTLEMTVAEFCEVESE